MAQAIPIGLAVAGSALSAGGTILGSNAEAKALRREAAQLEVNAGLERASSQRRMIEEKRSATLANSRALALAAASGASADDPTIVNLMAGIEGEGEYRALTALYEGETQAQGMEDQARQNRVAAKATKKAGMIKAAGTILSAGSSIYDRFGK